MFAGSYRMMSNQFQITGEWDSRKNCCGMGYNGVWDITENGEEIIVKEMPGSRCCIFVPNCIPKTHHMKKINENKWQGTYGCKTVSITRISDNELSHRTTDGYFTLTRRQ